LQQTGFFQMLQDTAMGTVRLGGVPVLFDGQRPGVKMPPRLGEHTLSSLRAAGASASQIDAWLACGAIGQNEGFES
jgi:crotonobetainyl-CoA:carnitine CoA-transferase CaiB-like acyl-CoA transferase